MVLSPFQQPNRRERYPERLERLSSMIQQPDVMMMPVHSNVSNASVQSSDSTFMADRVYSSNRSNNTVQKDAKIDLFSNKVMVNKLAGSDAASNAQMLTTTPSNGSDKTSDTLTLDASPKTTRQHLLWCEIVKKMKEKSASVDSTVKEKPFSNFSTPKTMKPAKLSDPQSLHQDSLHVRFQENKGILDQIVSNVDDVLADGAIPTSSVSTRSTQSSRTSLSSRLTEHGSSKHRCSRIKHSNKHINKQLFYTKSEIKQTCHESKQCVKSFRVDHAVSVKQLEKFFQEFCSCDSNTTDDDNELEVNEEKEEFLREFLQDWSGSDVRGLEDAVTLRKTFRQDRKMAVESVLAHQEKLREQQKQSEQLSNNVGDDKRDQTAELMAESLRARSESASHRARMFALYLALGDALAASANDNSRMRNRFEI